MAGLTASVLSMAGQSFRPVAASAPKATLRRAAPQPSIRAPMPLPIAEQWFRRETFAEGITLLSETYVDPFARCNVWHVRGRDRDLVIDTGLGLCSLRAAATDLF